MVSTKNNFSKNSIQGANMKIDDELKGKEVIDDKGDKIGEISDVDWNPEMNKVESLVVSEGASSKIGLGEKRVISFNDVDSIGDKVILRRSMPK